MLRIKSIRCILAMFDKSLLQLWLFHFFFPQSANEFKQDYQRHFSVKEIINLYAKHHPDWIIRYLAGQQSLAQRTSSSRFLQLPWSCFEAWPEILKIFQSSKMKGIFYPLGQQVFLFFWIKLLKEIIPLTRCYQMSGLGLIFSCLLIFRSYYLNQKGALELASFFYHTKFKKCSYLWEDGSSYPKALPHTWRKSYQKFQVLARQEEKKTCDMMQTYAQLQYNLSVSSRQRFTYSMIYIIFFSCLMATGQEFMEHLYCAHYL